MSKRELSELREAFKLDVLFGGDPDARPLPCWFQGVDHRRCEGRPRAAHFLKRRRVEKLVNDMLWGILVRDALPRDGQFEPDEEIGWHYLASDLVPLAAWDPRNGVPSCEAHDMRHDSLQMPPLVVAAHQVPLDVAMFCLDWGIEHELERRCPLFSPENCTGVQQKVSTLSVARSERALFDG